jgi:hypothetical protein
MKIILFFLEAIRMYKQPENEGEKWTPRLYTDASTLASSAIGGAILVGGLFSFIAPGPVTLVGAVIGGVAGATSVNYLTKYEHEKRMRNSK